MPDLKTVLGLINGEFITEKVSYAEDLARHNPLLLETVRSMFAGADHMPIPHETILTEMAAKAKVIVRTGAFDPWGNILLYSGVEPKDWFNKPGVVPNDYYAEKLKKG